MKFDNDDNDLLWSIIIIILNIITICNEIWFKYKFAQFKGLSMTKQELIKQYQSNLKDMKQMQKGILSNAQKNGTLLELDLLDLMRSKHYAELYERVIKELENLDQSKVASISNDLRNSFLHMADEINYLYHEELRNDWYFRGYMYSLYVSNRSFISFRNSNLYDSYVYQRTILK